MLLHHNADSLLPHPHPSFVVIVKPNRVVKKRRTDNALLHIRKGILSVRPKSQGSRFRTVLAPPTVGFYAV